MPPRFIGVVHLPPLPGGPRPSPGLDAVIERAVADAETLARGGADGLVVENLGDAPFAAEQVDPYTIAAMTRAVAAVRVAVPTLELGVNVLRNDAAAALSIAAATDASFIRINVHIGAMVTDQGLIQGQARETLLLRRRLAAEVKIVADVLVKHASPLGSPSLEDAADENGELLGKVYLAARDAARKEGIAHEGYRTVLNTGANGGQVVFHLHVHLLGGRAMGWPPG